MILTVSSAVLLDENLFTVPGATFGVQVYFLQGVILELQQARVERVAGVATVRQARMAGVATIRQARVEKVAGVASIEARKVSVDVL